MPCNSLMFYEKKIFLFVANSSFRSVVTPQMRKKRVRIFYARTHTRVRMDIGDIGDTYFVCSRTL